jgi:hypothetical protein
VVLAFVAQRIEHLTTDQKVGGSSPSKRTGLIAGKGGIVLPKVKRGDESTVQQQ